LFFLNFSEKAIIGKIYFRTKKIASVNAYNLKKKSSKSDNKWPRNKRFKNSFSRHFESNMAAKRTIGRSCDQFLKHTITTYNNPMRSDWGCIGVHTKYELAPWLLYAWKNWKNSQKKFRFFQLAQYQVLFRIFFWTQKYLFFACSTKMHNVMLRALTIIQSTIK